jgi:hypothetical protein
MVEPLPWDRWGSSSRPASEVALQRFDGWADRRSEDGLNTYAQPFQWGISGLARAREVILSEDGWFCGGL